MFTRRTDMNIRKHVIFFIIAITAIGGSLLARESYEDYIDQRNKKNYNDDYSISRDKPLSEIKPEDREDVLDEIRGAVREEIDSSLKDDRENDKKRVIENDFVEQVRGIVREEIEDAIKIKKSRYLKPGTFELGGYISYQARGVDSDENDNNNILKVFPQFAYFINENIALAIKGEAEFNITADTQAYSGGIGPQYVFGVTKKEDICFYTEIMAGISRNSSINDNLGYRYSNGFGFKFVMSNGVIINAGVQLIFDNLGESVEGFQNIIVPTVGITAWF